MVRPALPPSEVLVLSLAAGLAVRAAIQQVDSRVSADLKWPNDLLIRGAKIGGILTEMHAEPAQIRFVIVGIGLNVNQEKFPSELGAIATSLRVESGKPQSRLELLVRLLREFENDYNRFLVEGAESVTSRFAAISSYAYGKRVRVTNGNDSFAGVTAGLGPEGLLLVKRDGGQVVTVIAGDVTEERSKDTTK